MMPRFLILLTTSLLAMPAQAAVHVTIVQGLSGLPTYEAKFDTQRQQIASASRAYAGEERVSVFNGEDAGREAILGHLGGLDENLDDEDRSIVYLIGHGSFDGQQYKFNIPGPDITGGELAESMAALPGSGHLLVSTSSSSGALLEVLPEDGPLVVTATRNGNERNATEFGTYFARALNDESVDQNKDSHISVAEAFQHAQRGVEDFYESLGKLATEHPQMRGDGADDIDLARLDAATLASDNEQLQSLIEERRHVDADIEALQRRRNEMERDLYNAELRELVLESARLSEEIDALTAELEEGSSGESEEGSDA